MRFGTLSLVAFVLACQNDTVIEKQENVAPSVLIVSHSDGMIALDGYSERMRATVSDENHDFDELSVAWYVDETLMCDWATVSPGGDASCDIQFFEGNSSVIVQVSDPVGAGAIHEIAVNVEPTASPEVEIVTPDGVGNLYNDQLVSLSATVSDTEDDAQDLIVSWSSSLDGELSIEGLVNSSGEVSDYVYLTEGNHALQVHVEDSSGKIATDEVVVRVGNANTPPSCEITTPTEGETVLYGNPITFRGTSTDPDIPATDLQFEWASDKDGVLGSGAITSAGEITFSHTGLSGNNHVITLNVQDEIGAVCQDTLLLVVGTPPTTTIEDPLDGALFAVGESISFRGIVTDQEDALNTLQVSWVSSIDGVLQSGTSNSQGVTQFSMTDLSAGTHLVSLSTTDSTALIGDDTISVLVNTPPVVDSIQLTPSTVYASDSLTVSATLSDQDGNTTTPYYQWYENGILTPYTTTTIPSSELDVGDVWTVRVTPDDGFHPGIPEEASITVSNSIPVVQNVSISPNATVYNDTMLTCSAIATDADQTVTPTFEWAVNGSMYTGVSLDLATVGASVGDTVTCTANVIDAQGASASLSSIVVIDNRTPSITNLSIVPNAGVEADALLTCSGVGVDLDNDALTWGYEWMFNGQSLNTGDTTQLDAAQFAPGDVVECIATVEDPHGSSVQSSTSVVIDNTPPTIDSLTLTPIEPSMTDVVTCSASASDLNGDTPTVAFAFTNQTSGSVYVATSSTSTTATLDLSTIQIASNDVLECSIVASDLQGATTTDSTVVTVINSAPTFTQSATITPASGIVTDTQLTCSASAVDPDGGTVNLTYSWSLGGQTIANGSTFLTDAATTDVGDVIQCLVVAVDSDGEISSSSSNAVTVDNTIAQVDSVQISPATVYTNDTISAVATASDIDGDAIVLNYEWHVVDASANGADVIVSSGAGTTFSTLLGTNFDRDDEVYLIVAADDGRGSSTFSSLQSNTVEVLNTAPTGTTVVVTSSGTPPYEGIDDLTCDITVVGTDLDGDALLYTYEWIDPNGSIQQTYSATTDLTDVLLAVGTASNAGDWTCQVTTTDGDLTYTTSSSILVDSLWAGVTDFGNCGQTGHTGPSQSQCDSEYTGSTLEGLVSVSGGFQTWEVPSDGVYSIEANGARGGGTQGGAGASMYGEFQLFEGDMLTIVVGQQGLSESYSRAYVAGGGGGGSFVVLNGSPLIIAGGGGASGSDQVGYGGISAETDGRTGSAGNGGSQAEGCGGAGFTGNGTGSAHGGITVAKSFTNGANGGIGSSSGGTGYGGFGGGGCDGHADGGGGGGYSGGNGYSDGAAGGGGGSYNIGTNPINQSGVNTGHGYVIIDRL